MLVLEQLAELMRRFALRCPISTRPSSRVRLRGREGSDCYVAQALPRTLGTGAERNTLLRSWNHSSQNGHVLSRFVRHLTLRISHQARLSVDTLRRCTH